MAINGANNVSITLQFTLTSGATTIILPTGKGGLFTGATTPLRGVIEEFDDSKNVVKREIVSITGISGDQLTIARAVEPCPIGDSASAQQQVSQVFNTPAKTKISVVMTKGILDDINTSISGIQANKLAKTELRSGLGVKKVLITDASGNEVEISGTSGQVLGFGAGNVPQAVSPSVDIGGLTEKTTPIGNDKTIISDSEASGVNKQITLKSLEATMSYFGDGSDGNVTISGTVTLTRDMFYNNLTLSDGSILKTNGYKIFVNGTLSRPGTGYIDVSGGNGGNGADGGNYTPSPGNAGSAGVAAYTVGTLPVPFSGKPGDYNSADTGNNNGASTSRGLIYVNGTTSGFGGDSTESGPTTKLGRAGVGGGSFTASTNTLHSIQQVYHLLDIASSVQICELAPSSSGGESAQTSFCGNGGGSGANGGAIYAAIRTIDIAGATAVFRAKGGNGGNGGNGGAYSSTYRGGGGGGESGGQGGIVIIITGYTNVTLSSFIDVSGGALGNGGIKSPSNNTLYAKDGGPGSAGNPGRIVIYNLSA